MASCLELQEQFWEAPTCSSKIRLISASSSSPLRKSGTGLWPSRPRERCLCSEERAQRLEHLTLEWAERLQILIRVWLNPLINSMKALPGKLLYYYNCTNLYQSKWLIITFYQCLNDNCLTEGAQQWIFQSLDLIIYVVYIDAYTWIANTRSLSSQLLGQYQLTDISSPSLILLSYQSFKHETTASRLLA